MKFWSKVLLQPHAGRVVAEGIVETYTSDDIKSAGIIEFNCETDFVAANEEFVELKI